MKKSLPSEAYIVLQALQEQDKAVRKNNCRGDIGALLAAQKKLTANIEWIEKINALVFSFEANPKLRKIKDLDKEWLDELFRKGLIKC